MHEMSFAEGIATAVVNPRIRLSVQLTNILMQPRHLGGESLGPAVAPQVVTCGAPNYKIPIPPVTLVPVPTSHSEFSSQKQLRGTNMPCTQGPVMF